MIKKTLWEYWLYALTRAQRAGAGARGGVIRFSGYSGRDLGCLGGSVAPGKNVSG